MSMDDPKDGPKGVSSDDAAPGALSPEKKPMEPPSAPVTKEELEEYMKHKGELLETLRREGNSSLLARHESGYVGLYNQGATCYMNSLLQSLFTTVEFRERLFAWRFDAEKDGDPKECIPLQLQRLFAKMQGSKRMALSTGALTKSFGWSPGEAFKQHDVQELCRVLFEALTDVTHDEKMVNDLYGGKLIDYLKCEECGHTRSRIDKYLDIELTVANMKSLEESLSSFVTPEVLDGDNKWFCEKCDQKVAAKKGFKFRSLPPILTFAMKRFTFNFELMRRVKLMNTFSFPKTLDMGAFHSSGSTYELFSILIHDGSAMGGHYYAYINPPEKDEWLEFNDATVRPISDEQLLRMMDEAAWIEKRRGDNDDRVDKALEAEGGGAKDEAPEDVEGDKDDAPKDGKDDAPKDGKDDAPKDGKDDAPEDGKDEAYKGMTDEEIAKAEEAKAFAKGGTVAEGPSTIDKPPAAFSKGNGAKAYMLLYRLVKKASSEPPAPPADLATEVEEDNKVWKRLKTLYDTRQRVVEMRVFAAGEEHKAEEPKAEKPKAEEPKAEAAKAEAADAKVEGGVVPAAEAKAGDKDDGAAKDGEPESKGDADADADAGAGYKPNRPKVDGFRDCILDIPVTCTIEDAMEQAYEQLIAPYPARAIPKDRVRLRKFAPQTRRFVDTYDPKVSLEDAGLKHAAAMVLETRNADEEWVEYNPNEMVVRVTVWDAESKAASADPDKSYLVKVPGDQAATVASLQAEVEALTAIPAARQRIIRLTRDEAVVLTDPEKELKLGFGIWCGDDLVVEEFGEGETVLSESVALSMHDAAKNAITITFNKPDEPNDFDTELNCNRRETLEAVKIRIAEKLEMSSEDFHLRLNSRAPQIKDETVTLKELELTDGSILFVQRGAPLRPDEVLLKVYLFDTDGPKPTMKKLLDLPAGFGMTIASLKKRLSGGVNHEATKLRLRDKSGQEAGKIYRDARTVKQEIQPFRRLKDGREICVQKLDMPEKVGPDDMVLSVRRFRPLAPKRRLGRVQEITLPKRTSVAQLRERLATQFGVGVCREDAPEPAGADEDGRETKDGDAETKDEGPKYTPAEELGPIAGSADDLSDDKLAECRAAVAGVPLGVGIGKCSQFGPPLTLPSVMSKPKWNNPLVVEEETITTMPLGLRDGNLLLYRDEWEFQVALAQGVIAQITKPKAGAAGKGGARLGGRKPGFGRGTGTKPKPRPDAGGVKIRRGPSPAISDSTPTSISTTPGGATPESTPGSTPTPASDASGEWACGVCTLLNSAQASVCEICGSPK